MREKAGTGSSHVHSPLQQHLHGCAEVSFADDSLVQAYLTVKGNGDERRTSTVLMKM